MAKNTVLLLAVVLDDDEYEPIREGLKALTYDWLRPDETHTQHSQVRTGPHGVPHWVIDGDVLNRIGPDGKPSAAIVYVMQRDDIDNNIACIEDGGHNDVGITALTISAAILGDIGIDEWGNLVKPYYANIGEVKFKP